MSSSSTARLTCSTLEIRLAGRALASRAWRALFESFYCASIEVEEARQDLRPGTIRVAEPLRAFRAVTPDARLRPFRADLLLLEGARSAQRQVPEPRLLRGFHEGLPRDYSCERPHRH